MQCRALGNTGLRVSEIGLSCENFNGKDQALTDEVLTYDMQRSVKCIFIVYNGCNTKGKVC